MEVRARYVRMGAFTLAVLLLGFGFVYWLNNSAGFGNRVTYRVEFGGPVAGLLRGSAVLFNGIRVGEVTELALDPARPRQVIAKIVIDRDTPVRTDTDVSIDFQGLTGSPVVTLTRGRNTDVPVAPGGNPPVLKARADAGQTMSQSARDVLHRLDGILAENAEPLRSMLASIDTFAGALARNSDKVDGIVAGLERMTGEWTYEGASVPDQPEHRRQGVATVSRRGAWTIIEMDTESRFTLAFNPRTGRIEGEFIHWAHPNLWVYDGAVEEDDRLHLRARGPSFDVEGEIADYDDVLEIVSPAEMRMTGRMLGADGRWRDFTVSTFQRKGAA